MSPRALPHSFIRSLPPPPSLNLFLKQSFSTNRGEPSQWIELSNTEGPTFLTHTRRTRTGNSKTMKSTSANNGATKKIVWIEDTVTRTELSKNKARGVFQTLLIEETKENEREREQWIEITQEMLAVFSLSHSPPEQFLFPSSLPLSPSLSGRVNEAMEATQ